MIRVRSLLPQKIAVRPGFFISQIGLPALLPDGKRYGAVRIFLPDRPHNPADPLVRIVHVFAALQDKGPKSQRVPLLAAAQDLLVAEPVALRFAVAPANAAVPTVIPAVVGELYEPAQIDVFSVILLPYLSRGGVQDRFLGRAHGSRDGVADLHGPRRAALAGFLQNVQELVKSVVRKRMFPFQDSDQFFGSLNSVHLALFPYFSQECPSCGRSPFRNW